MGQTERDCESISMANVVPLRVVDAVREGKREGCVMPRAEVLRSAGGADPIGTKGHTVVIGNHLVFIDL